ncbi:MAG: tripartite tricarboxylate transporter TctB family protein [Desulfovibrio sp.]|jgi:ABC-type Na+ efflux pump permease subunit|nr:tripartite tricarboxylate transporter TctB family protein [Desulfovibrio sp.]
MRSGVKDIAAGLFSLLAAAAFFCQSGDVEGVGLLYPQLIMGFIASGGVYLVALGLWKRRSGRDEAGDGEAVARTRVAMIAVGSLAYALIIPLLGFYAASVVFLFGSAMALNDTGAGPRKAALSASVLTMIMCLAVWAGFSLLLHVPTPDGLLF